MRRKLAALLAGAMVLTSLPMVSFAVSTNRVSRVPVIAKDQTIGEVGGSYLTIEEKDYFMEEIKAGEYFNLILKNGKWEDVSETLYNPKGEEADNQFVNFDKFDGYTMKKLTDTKVQIQVYKNTSVTDRKEFAFAIPLDNVKCTEEADVELTIDDYDSGVSKGTYVIAEFAKDATKAKIDSKSFNNVLDLNTLEIEELKIGTLKNGELRLEILNDDFAWIWNPGVASEVTVEGDGTLSNAKIKAVIDDVKSSNSVLVLEIRGIDADADETREQRATLYISGLQIIAKRNADFGEVEVEIDGSHDDGCGVTKEVLKVGEYVDFGIKVSVAEEKDLVAGYDKQTYKITLEEVVQGSWASERRTTIKFPDYVRIVDKSAVKIIDADCENIGVRRKDYLYVDDDDNVVKSKYAYMECDDHWIDFANIKKEDSTKTTKLVFEVTLEAKAASSGDITATFEGNALLGYEEELVLGEVTVPFTVDVEAKELKAGLKVQDAGTITVTETDKGKLTKGTKLYFELEDYVSWETKPEVKVDGDIEVEASILEEKAVDKYFETVPTRSYTYEVYDANTYTKLKLDPDDDDEDKEDKFAEGLTWTQVLEVLKKYEDNEKIDPYVRRRTTTSTLSRIYEYEFAKTSGRVLVVEVKKASRKQASTITLEGAKLLVDRTIPEGTFDMAVRTLGDKWNGWGSWYKDLYVDIITPNTEDIEQSKNAKYTATFTLDSVNYTVDGVTLQADVAPYAKDGRIMVPVRYVAQGLGVNPDDVLFSNKTVTIMNGNRIVQLVLGSNVMKVNGAEITMDTVAEAKDGRIFVPMGWIAKGLGVPVQWDNNTKTATFN